MIFGTRLQETFSVRIVFLELHFYELLETGYKNIICTS